jgi:diguanylate cyclase (GGDEF)-like protein
VVLSGELLVHLGTDVAEHVAALGPGETAGEMSVLDRRPVSAYVSARDAARVLVIREDMFWRMCQASHGITVRLMMKLTERLRESNGVMQDGLSERAKLEEAAHRDALTGVNSRRWLDETLPRMCAAHAQSGKALSVAVVDIDHFKRVNDTYGHQTGDLVLAEIANILRAKLRPSDYVARFGGEEFVVILPETYQLGARVACERLADAVRAATLMTRDGDLLPRVTVSVGLAELAQGDDQGSLFERADAALYRAKNNGRDRVES